MDAGLLISDCPWRRTNTALSVKKIGLVARYDKANRKDAEDVEEQEPAEIVGIVDSSSCHR